MNVKVTTGMLALALAFAGTAHAGIPEDGLYRMNKSTPNGVVGYEFRLEKVGTRGENGIFLIHTGDDEPAYLSAESSDEGASVDFKGSTETHWVVIENGAGWSFHPKDNGANCLSITDEGRLQLQRARGNANQMWKMKMAD